MTVSTDAASPEPAAGVHGTPDDAEPTQRAPDDERAGPTIGAPPGQRWSRLQVLGAAIAGSIPVLWVLGALPWRTPTLLIENMFRGFVACADDGGLLNPIVMLCPRAGAPVGMHQLDGGLSYPLGGLMVRLGVEPLAAWKLSVALLIVPGFAALFWLARRFTASPLIAAGLVVLYGFNGTLTARSWNWYWNIVAVSMLPTLFAVLYVVFDRAAQRRLRAILWPGAAALSGVLAISIEWQYAGLFATAIALAAVCLLLARRGWSVRQRALLATGGLVGFAVVFAILRWRLTLAGIRGQFADTVVTATTSSVDVAALVVPDGRQSLLGKALSMAGDDRLVRSMSQGHQLWVVPYLGVLALVVLAVAVVMRRARPAPNPRLPAGFLSLLVLVTVGSIILSMGPVIHVAGLSDPGASAASPLALLWTSTPLRWIRYPWTWGYVTHVTVLLLYAALATLLLRDQTSWSPLVWVLSVVLVLEFVSPQVLLAFDTPRPSISTAPGWVRIGSTDPTVARFERTAVPELKRALRSIDGPVVFLPWSNSWIMPHLGPDVGVRVRNVGIDRNVQQVEAAAPFTRHQLRDPSLPLVEQMFERDWVDAVVLLDHIPTSGSILRFDHQHPTPGDLRWLRWIRHTGNDLVRAGYCVTPRSWFSVLTRCAGRLPPRAVPSAADLARPLRPPHRSQ